MHTGGVRRIGWHTLAHELKQYAVIAAYLYAWFFALLLYKSAVLQGHGISFAPYGLAAIKALVLGKFVLVAHQLKIGERHGEKPLVYGIVYQSLVFLVLLVALSFVEEIVSGSIHGRALHESLSEIGGGTWLEIIATCVLLWFVLLPYFAYRRVSAALGPETLRRMMFGSR